VVVGRGVVVLYGWFIRVLHSLVGCIGDHR
jgi:hypothetical protein